MMKRFGVALFAAGALGACPPEGFDSIQHFNLDTFVSKRWYIQEQAVSNYLPIEQNFCVYAEYKKRSKPSLWGYDIDVHNHAEEKDGKVHDSGDFLFAKVVDAKTGKLEVAPWFLPTYFSGPYWVIDYNEQEGYALISGGAPKIESKKTKGKCTTGSGTNNSGLWIFTREQHRDQKLVDKVRAIADEKGFDLSVLNDVDHTNCKSNELNHEITAIQV